MFGQVLAEGCGLLYCGIGLYLDIECIYVCVCMWVGGVTDVAMREGYRQFTFHCGIRSTFPLGRLSARNKTLPMFV